MKTIQHFNFNGTTVRLTEQRGVAWFLAKDICQVIGLKENDIRAILEPDEIRVIDPKDYTVADKNVGSLAGMPGVRFVIGEAGGENNILLVNESGLYLLISRSRRKNAQDFRQWVAREMIPMLRQVPPVDPIVEAFADAMASFKITLEIHANTIERLIDHCNAQAESTLKELN